MDAIVTELVKQIPSLAVLSWLVYMFLENLKQRDRALNALGENCHSFQIQIQDRYKSNIMLMGTALENNTKALNENTHALGRIESVLEAKEAHRA